MCNRLAHLAQTEAQFRPRARGRWIRREQRFQQLPVIPILCMVLLHIFTLLAPAQPVYPATAICRDTRTRLLMANCRVTVTVKAKNNTGGHFHNSNRPKSKVASRSTGPFQNSVTVTTGYGGYAIFWMQPSDIGQVETFKACADECRDLVLKVGYHDLEEVPESSKWIRVGGHTTQHGGNDVNHFMTVSARRKLELTVTRFLELHPQQGKIAVNDMSLPLGGVFDLGRRWVPPHHRHSRGTAVDVRARTSPGGYSIPASRVRAFLNQCDRNGADRAMLESPGTSNQHIHCDW